MADSAGQATPSSGPGTNGELYPRHVLPLFTSEEYVGLFVVNGISILCSLFVVGFIHMYRSTISMMAATRQRGKRRTIRRPVGTQAAMYLQLPASLRLLFLASIIDVLYSGFRIYNIVVSMPRFSGSQQANCEASMTGVTFFNLLSVFVRALLSVHLQLVIINNVGQALSYERHFLTAAFVVSVVVSVLPLFTHNYVWLNFDPTMGSAHCGYFQLQSAARDAKDASTQSAWSEEAAQRAIKKGLAMMWSTNFAWVTLTVFYGALVIVSIVIRLAHQHNTLNRIADGQGMILEQAYRRKRQFLLNTAKVVRRILQFPMMVVVCHVLEVIYGMATLRRALNMISANSVSTSPPVTNQGLRRLYLASQFMLGMEGIITLFFLPLEPPIRLMLRRHYQRRKSDLRRLGTTRRTVKRRHTENWPSARPRQSAQYPDYQGGLSTAVVPTWCDEAPTMLARDNGSNSRGVDHFVTKTTPENNDHPDSGSNSSPGLLSSVLPLRAATVRWRRNQLERHIKRPMPVHRSKTLDEFPWDVVAVPRQGESSSGTAAEHAPLPEHVISSTVQAMRNDGLPTQQWYIPESLSRAATATDLSAAAQGAASANNTLVTASSSHSRSGSNNNSDRS
ncbi:hypothetical protein LPJ56_000226 [Coemansia sp. RSA 2599]|nr:hypothetical protein LPJ75_001565 [Coemansia sp. RSA 2598]KAJ1829577.1 hypothetical protein LPJ56_000226 [Coemansia sp. RSA 2599]